MKRRIITRALMIIFILALFLFSYSSRPSELTQIRLWHSYTGTQSEMFEKLVTEYNNTVGKERGVEIISYYKGSTEELSTLLTDLPIEELPSIIAVSGDSAYSAYLKNKIACAEDYLSSDVLAAYPEGVLNAGRFTYSTGVYYFPLMSIIDILYVNSGLINEFVASDGTVNISDLETWDGIYSMAEAYYEWSGGKPFIAINEPANYLLTVSKQNMASIIQSGGRGINIVFNSTVLRSMWDFYHGGYVRGYIADGNNTANSLMEAGELVCFIGSTEDVWSMPTRYTTTEGTVKNLELVACKYPQVSSGSTVIPVKTEGVAVVDKDKTSCQESYVFLNWLCNNTDMSRVCTVGRGLPVSLNLLSDGSVLKEMESSISAAGRSRGITSLYSEAYLMADEASLYSPALFVGRNDFENDISASLVKCSLRDRNEYISRVSAGEDPETVLAELDSEELFKVWLNELELIQDKY